MVDRLQYGNVRFRSEKTKCSPNAGVMLGQRRRRWSSITSALVRHLVSTGSPLYKLQLSTYVQSSHGARNIEKTNSLHGDAILPNAA